jgi:hypothetical protein
VREYFEQSLPPYLTAMAKEACATRALGAPKAGRYKLCVPVSQGAQGVEPLDDPKSEGVTIPPKDGKPFPRPDTLRGKADTIDNEVSAYIEDSLRPYLGSLGMVICAVRASATPNARRYLCIEKSKAAQGPRLRSPVAAETLPPPPKDRKVYPAPVSVPVGPDFEVRVYIENKLRPYLISLAKVACQTRAVAAPRVGRYGVCVLPSGGAGNVEALDEGPRGEGVTIPPKDGGKPFPSPEGGPPRPGNPSQ